MAFGSPQWMYKSGEAFTIAQSLRFNDDDTPYLNWTPSGSGTLTTHTLSMWIKLGRIVSTYGDGSHTYPFMCRDGSGNTQAIRIRSDDTLQWYHYASSYQFNLNTNMLLRYPSAWYHIVAVLDSTQGTASNRAKLYVNGVEASLQTATYPSEDHDGLATSAIVHLSLIHI